MPTYQNNVSEKLNTAYTYLSNPLTKIIYDEFGVLGLAIYEEEKKKFFELQEEIRIVNQEFLTLEDLIEDEETKQERIR